MKSQLVIVAACFLFACNVNLPKLGVGLCDGDIDCPVTPLPDLQPSDLAPGAPDLSCPAESCYRDANVIQAVYYVRDANGQCVRGVDTCRVGWDCSVTDGNAVCYDARRLDMGSDFAKCSSVLPLLDDCFKRFQQPAARQNCYAPIVAMTEGGALGKAGWLATCVNQFCDDRTLPTGACVDKSCNGLNPDTSCCVALNACVTDR